MSELEELNVSRTRVTDALMAPLFQLVPHLRTLRIACTSVSDESIPAIVGMCVLVDCFD